MIHHWVTGYINNAKIIIQIHFNRLVTYKENNGSTKVPHKFPEDPSLGNWVVTQRQAKNKNSLLPKRQESLETD